MYAKESDSRSTMLMKENNQLKGELVTSKKEADDLKRVGHLYYADLL